jgi:hypothetical protein
LHRSQVLMAWANRWRSGPPGMNWTGATLTS